MAGQHNRCPMLSESLPSRRASTPRRDVGTVIPPEAAGSPAQICWTMLPDTKDYPTREAIARALAALAPKPPDTERQEALGPPRSRSPRPAPPMKPSHGPMWSRRYCRPIPTLLPPRSSRRSSIRPHGCSSEVCSIPGEAWRRSRKPSPARLYPARTSWTGWRSICPKAAA